MSDFEKDNITHAHNGVGSPKINPRNLLGFQIFTSAPTHDAKEGTLVLANESGTYKLYAYINGGWRGITLT